MYLTLHLPALPLEALLRRHPEKRQHPCAVLSSSIVNPQSSTLNSPSLLACNRRATSFGLTPGLSITRALARCPNLQILPRSPDTEITALQDLLSLAESFTPDFELTTPDTLILDLSGTLPPQEGGHSCPPPTSHREATLSPHSPARHHPESDGGALGTRHSHVAGMHAAAITETLKHRLPPLGLPVHLATADTPDLAHLLTLSSATSHSLIFRGPDHRWTPQKRSADFRPHLPPPLSLIPTSALSNLKLKVSSLELLHQWGLHTLGDLARLPRQGLAERLGPELAHIHDILHAKHHRPLRLFHPIESFDSSIHLDHPIDSSSALTFCIKRLIQTICNRLGSRYLSTSEARLHLQLDNRQTLQKTLRFPEPSACPQTLLPPLQAHLESLSLSAPVVSIELALIPGPASPGQHQLFDHSIRQPHRLADTLIRLETLLGTSNIGFPVPAFTHRPDTFHLSPAHQIFQGSAASADSTRRKTPPTATHHSTPTTRLSAMASATSQHSRISGHPLSRFRPPIEIAVAFEKEQPHPRPLALLTGPHRGRIATFRGPFPISGHWWDPQQQWQQLEWDIQLETHHLLRLAHLPPQTWQLQGAYP